MEPTRAILDVTIHEGRNRQVRRMCQAAGLEVARLKRIAEGGLRIGELKPGAWRYLEPRELELLLQE
jgi:23S rRNA pseudouridine2605 synthase